MTDQEREMAHSEQATRRKRRENVAAMLAEMKGTDREVWDRLGHPDGGPYLFES